MAEYGENYLKAVERKANGSTVKAVRSFPSKGHAGRGDLAKAELDIAGMKMAERIGRWRSSAVSL